MEQSSIPQNENGLANIRHVVVLMFENRSFDHLFGAFPGVDGLIDGDGNIKSDFYNLVNPFSPPTTSQYPPNTNPQYFPTPIDPNGPLQHDFTHDFGDGMMPDLFGPIFTTTGAVFDPSATYTSGYTTDENGNPQILGMSQPVQPTTYPATNSGFLTTYNSCMQQGRSALSYFSYGDLKVLHTLAQEFVLCDNWHCDMPGHTKPNRLFIHCGSTAGLGIDDTDGGTATAPSIFDNIDNMSGQQPGQPAPTWNMYILEDGNGCKGGADTRFLDTAVQHSPNVVPITQFAADCVTGTLPFYSFIMCWWPNSTVYTDTSMHPNSMIQPGENLLAAVYNTLRQSQSWADTLLIVTFDENGGIYDHKFPPQTTPPDSSQPITQSVVGCCGNNWTLNSTFDFSLLGLRIPALLISPWLSKGIYNTPLQNTSALRFVIDRISAIYGTSVQYMTERDTNAPKIDDVFATMGQSIMRTDCPGWIQPYSTLPCTDPDSGSNDIVYNGGTLFQPWTAPSSDTATPVPYINEYLNIYVSPLPGHPDSGKKITRSFATNAEVAEYTKEREDAANEYYKSRG